MDIKLHGGMIMKIWSISIFLLLILIGCTNNGKLTEEPENKSITGDEPPKAMIQIGNQLYETKLGSYCWTSRCVDTAGPTETLKDKNPITVNPGDEINFVMEYQPKPNKFHLEQFNENKQSEVALNNNGFNAPVQEGIYYYSYGTWWMDEKEANVSRGSAFYAFVIKVN